MWLNKAGCNGTKRTPAKITPCGHKLGKDIIKHSELKIDFFFVFTCIMSTVDFILLGQFWIWFDVFVYLFVLNQDEKCA